MNKKGFTLIELLVTILILSIIMLIAIPNVMSTIDKNKQSTYVETAKRMITLAEYKVRSDTTITLPTNNGEAIVILLNALDKTEFKEGPEGGTYDYNSSYVVIARNANKYLYLSTITENFEGSKRGIPLKTRADLNKENAKKFVVKDSQLIVDIPTIGSNLAGYEITHIVNNW